MKIRETAKKIPGVVSLVQSGRNLNATLADWMRRTFTRNYNRKVFSRIFRTKYWGTEWESVSGAGSTLAATVGIRTELPQVARRLGVRTLVDAPCGDFVWMRELAPGFESYVGVDVVPELIAANNRQFAGPRIRFATGDITVDEFPRADAVLCRDCLIHLSTPLVWAALRNFKRTGYKYLFLTHDDRPIKYREIVTGDWRPINWRLPPFGFPRPVETIVENTGDARHLAVWELGTLPL